ncbi:MAG: extracellular solute-binding protein, partial [Armatimonadetes bacterium]|nr:extracellular solute-binding protein [Armatimonadota bacterium]
MGRLGPGGRLLVLLLFLGVSSPVRADTTLTVFAQAYTPEITTGDNPRPLHEFTRLAQEFERLHPGVKVKFQKSPVGDFRTWMRTQLQGGMAPDVMWSHSTYTNEDAKYGWFVNLDPYLAQPNPYCGPGVRGHERWSDQFYVEATNAKRAPDGHLYSLPIDQVETCIYYNQDLLDSVGAGPPRSWEEWMEIHRKLEAKGIIPFLMTGSQEMRFTWTRRILNDQLWADLVPKMDVRTTEGWGFPGVDQQEF